ncbi:hypothetical protein C3B64_17695 [Clostridium botulinum]|uniref:GIY-YIG domain-containing protein n=1 Tax=Clostridium botulinum TaxID=1491 RepID=A0AAU8Z240_CLOBO|nr:hypothetical protein C3B64_17695 [Clostridium botulinum]
MILTKILELKKFNMSKIKLVRHTVNRDYIKKLIDFGQFDLYQSVQKNDIFKNTDYFISFTDMQGSKALLYGVYKINGAQEILELPSEINLIKEAESWGEAPYYKYNLERDYSLADLEGRLVIDWGKAAILWHQRKLDKEIVEILPNCFVKIFPGYEEVILSFEELSKIINNPDANIQWEKMLSNVYGVYLILDTKSGQQYIGSAYGKDGIGGRWSHYVQSKHGDNKILIKLLNDDPLRYKKFQFSILNVLPNSTIKEQVIQRESIIKEKLGTRIFGLNAN